MNRKPSAGVSSSKNASGPANNYGEKESNFAKGSGNFAAARAGHNQNQTAGVATGSAYQARSGFAAGANNFPSGGQSANSSN